jgi:fused signal recognition particle receptor
MARLKAGLSKTSASLSLLFVGAKIDDDLYEELESALLMADAGMDATEFLLDALRKKVKEDKLLDAAAVKAALKVLMIAMLKPLEKPLELGRHEPLVMMIAGVNGAGTTPRSASWPSTCKSTTSRCSWPPATPSARPRASS